MRLQLRFDIQITPKSSFPSLAVLRAGQRSLLLPGPQLGDPSFQDPDPPHEGFTKIGGYFPIPTALLVEDRSQHCPSNSVPSSL